VPSFSSVSVSVSGFTSENETEKNEKEKNEKEKNEKEKNEKEKNEKEKQYACKKKKKRSPMYLLRMERVTRSPTNPNPHTLLPSPRSLPEETRILMSWTSSSRRQLLLGRILPHLTRQAGRAVSL